MTKDIAAAPAKMTTANLENLLIKYSLFALELQGLFGLVSVDSGAIFAALCLIGGVI